MERRGLIQDFLGLFEEKADLGDKISFVLYMLIIEVESGVF